MLEMDRGSGKMIVTHEEKPSPPLPGIAIPVIRKERVPEGFTPAKHNGMPDRVTQDICILFWKGDKLVAMERKNGHMERYMTREANFGDTAELFGAHAAEPNKRQI